MDALRQGLVDAAEGTAAANVYAGMMPNLGQMLEIGGPFPCSQHVGITTRKFQAMDTELQELMLESAYLTQTYLAAATAATDAMVIGRTEPQLPFTAYAKNNVPFSFFSGEELERCRQLASPLHNPGPYEEWRSRLNKMAGCDIFTEIKAVADELPEGETIFQMESRRWWKTE